MDVSEVRFRQLGKVCCRMVKVNYRTPDFHRASVYGGKMNHGHGFHEKKRNLR